jgi:hypothetical protein
MELAQSIDKSNPPSACVRFRLLIVATAVHGLRADDGSSGQAVFTSMNTLEFTAPNLTVYRTCPQKDPVQKDYPKVVFFFKEEDRSMAVCVAGEGDTTRAGCLKSPLAILAP